MLGEIADVNWGDTHTTKQSYSTTGFTAYSASGPDGLLPYADYDRTGIVLSAIGADCGKTWLAKGKWSCIKNTIRLFSKEDDVDTEFLYWATRDSDYWPKRGSAQPFISQGDARACVVRFPTISEQRAIAGVLRPLDDRIELNQRMNETLEAMARALFKSWFVDFDPVRAKMEERDPGLPPDIADLFPDRFVESELGEIPEGWNVLPLDEIAVFRNGLALQRFRPADNEEWLPVLKIAQLRRGSTDGVERARASIAPEFVVDDGDIVFSWSGSLELRIWTGGRAALNQHLFKVSSGSYPEWFVFRCVESHLRAFRAIAAGKATTMGHIKREHLREARCVCAEPRFIRRREASV